MPSHFHSACQSWIVAERGGLAVQRMREVERIGAMRVRDIAGEAFHQALAEVGRRQPVAAQSRRHVGHGDAGGRGERAVDELLRNAHAECAGQNFDVDEAGVAVEPPPLRDEACLNVGWRQSGEWGEFVLHPCAERAGVAALARRNH